MALYIYSTKIPSNPFQILFPKMSANEASSAKGIIRIVFAKNPPDAFTTCNTFPTMVPSVDCPFPGWLVEVVKMLADYLNLHIDPIIVSSVIGAVNWGHRVENGTLGNAPPLHHHHHQPKHNWTGILGILEEEGMADTICTLYPYTDEKAESFSFSHPVTGVRDIYIAKPKRKSLSMAVWNAFFPYEPKLWALLLLSLAIQCGFASLIANLEFRLNLRPNYNPLEKMWQYLRLQIHQATEFQTPFLLQSGNLAFLFYALIQATLFTQLYTAVLLSALIRGENPHPWESYNEMIRLIKSREYSLIMDKHHLEKDNSFYETLTFTGMSHLRNLANAIELNPIRKVDNVSQALDMVERGGFIYPTKQNSLAYQQSKERCDLFYFEDDHNQLPAFFIFSRHSKLLRDWNRAIQNNQAFIRRTYEKYFFHDFNTGNIPNCKRAAAPSSPSADDEEGDGNLRNNALDASRSLDIVSTFGIFLIAMIGFALAFLVFLCELLIHAKARRLRRKWRTRRALVLANPSWPTHLMAIANQMRAKRMAHADSQQSSDGPATAKELFMIPSALLYTNPGPPQLDRNVGQSWWRPKTRRIRPPCADFHRQRSIISAVTLAAISMQNQQQNGEMELRQRQNGKNEGNWAMLEGENGGEGKWARTAF